MPLTIKQVCEALEISRSRVEQWISRGFFRTPDKPVLGKARDWDISDAMRLKLMALLVEHSITPEKAGALVWTGLHGFKDDSAFFVAWGGWHEMAGGGKAHLPGTLYPKIVKGSDLGPFLANPEVEVSIVVNLDTLAASVEKRLEQFGAR